MKHGAQSGGTTWMGDGCATYRVAKEQLPLRRGPQRGKGAGLAGLHAHLSEVKLTFAALMSSFKGVSQGISGTPSYHTLY